MTTVDRNKTCPLTNGHVDDLDELSLFFSDFPDMGCSQCGDQFTFACTHNNNYTPAPSEDIWKKFELIQTPPISPQHETDYSSCLSSDPLVQRVSDSLDDFESDLPELSFFDDDLEKELNSNLIQDCMWSTFVNDSKSGKTNKSDSRGANPTVSKLSDMKSTGLSASTECVDPTSIFPYHPLHESRADSLGNETPSDSEEEEEEEIDVVTVPQPIVHRKKVIVTNMSSMSTQIATMHNYTAPAPPSPTNSSSGYSSGSSSPPPTPLRSSHHNYYNSSALKLKRSYQPQYSGSSNSKKMRYSLPHHQSMHSISRHHRHHRYHKKQRGMHSNSRNSSDSDESSEDKRSQHNILERRRRDDLKNSFSLLRAHVPDLDNNERAPKVVILRKAADYIHSVNHQDTLLQKELNQLKSRNSQLKQRLSLLKSM